MKFDRFARVLLLAVLIAGCGDDDDGTGPTGGAGLSVSTGDGTLNATGATALISNGLLSIGAAGTSGGVTRSIGIAIQAAAAGTFTVGPANGAVLTYTEVTSGSSSGKSWLAGPGSGSGTVTISQLTSTRVVGTFTATLAPVTSTGATATKTLTNGSFDIAITSNN